MAVNPRGRVPALITARGVLTETPAILAFVAQSFPAAGLAPLDDALLFARVQSFNSYLCSTAHVAHADKGRGYRWADDPAAIAELKRKVPETVAAGFELIERELFERPWVMGDTYSISDIYLFTLASWLERDEVDPVAFPRSSSIGSAWRPSPAWPGSWRTRPADPAPEALAKRALSGRCRR